MDYGAIPKGKVPRPEPKDDLYLGMMADPTSIALVSFFSGLTVFLVVQILFNTALYTNPNVVFSILFVLAVCSISAIVREMSLWHFSSMTSVWVRPIGVSCLVAASLGSVFGLFCYDTYGFFSFIYRNSRTYSNTVPSEPAASVADAGRMVFASEAYIDVTQAAGYAAQNRVTYCIAPIRDMVKTTHVEFWAVGYDCCGITGSFTCDDSADAKARGGIVVFDNPGYFTDSNRDYYDLARRKAEAQFDLVSAEKPIYVRWVKQENLGMLQKFYEGRSAAFVMLTGLLYAAVTFPFAFQGSIQYYKAFFRLDVV